MARRHDLDWLRIGVFGVLIAYHIGMVYVADWGFHYKSEHQFQWLKSIMILVNQWRLPLLFLISGIAIRLFLEHVSLWRFIGLRTWRLWIPLLFGIWVIVPPQLYVEMTVNGDLPDINYWEFYLAFLDLNHPYFEKYQSGIFPHVDVNHLWYIRELWWFSMYLLMLYLPLNYSGAFNYLSRCAEILNGITILILPILIMTGLGFWVFPADSEAFRKALGFSFLCCGFLIGWHEKFWELVQSLRRFFLVGALTAFFALITYYHLTFSQQSEPASGLTRFFEVLLISSNRWLWILTILGYGRKYLNKEHRLLHYFNQAVYPYYILHQTFIVVAAYCLSSLQLGSLLEPLLVTVTTIAGCALGYEIIRRFKLLRLLFGLKIGHSRNNDRVQK